MNTNYSPGPSVLPKLMSMESNLECNHTTHTSSSYFLRAMVEEIPLAMAVCDDEGIFRIWNSDANDIIKHGPKTIRPHEWVDIYGLCGDDKETPLADPPLLAALRDGEETECTMWFGLRNQFIHCSARPVFGQEGELVGAIVIFREEEHDGTEEGSQGQ